MAKPLPSRSHIVTGPDPPDEHSTVQPGAATQGRVLTHASPCAGSLPQRPHEGRGRRLHHGGAGGHSPCAHDQKCAVRGLLRPRMPDGVRRGAVRRQPHARQDLYVRCVPSRPSRPCLVIAANNCGCGRLCSPVRAIAHPTRSGTVCLHFAATQQCMRLCFFVYVGVCLCVCVFSRGGAS